MIPELLSNFLEILNFHKDFKTLPLKERHNIARKFLREPNERLEEFNPKTNEKTILNEKIHAYIKNYLHSKNLQKSSAQRCSKNDSPVTKKEKDPAASNILEQISACIPNPTSQIASARQALSDLYDTLESYKSRFEGIKMEQIFRQAQKIMDGEDLEKLRKAMSDFLKEGQAYKTPHPNHKNSSDLSRGIR